MSTQQDIYAAGSESHPPMLNKENHGRLIFFELKQIEADDQALQTILLGLPEDIYAAVDSCEIAQEIWLRVQQMMKGSDIRIQEKKANNLKFMNNLQPEWSRHVTIIHQTKDLYSADYTQLYDFLKYNQKEIDELKAERLAKIQDPLALMATSNNPYNFPRISSNPRNRQIAQPGMNMGQDRNMQTVGGNEENQFRQYAGQNVGNLNGYNAVQNVKNQVSQNPRAQNVGIQNGQIGVQGNDNQNQNENGNVVTTRAEGNVAGLMEIRYGVITVGEWVIMLRIARSDQREGMLLIFRQTDLDEIEEVNANCILMANLQQASTSGTQTDKAPVYDSDRSAEVHDYYNCDDNEIFNMFTQEEQYTKLLEPIPEPHQNLAIEVEKVNSVNRKLKETNANLTIELTRFKNQEKCFEISQEKYDKLERCYQQSVYQEQCLSKKINALHLNSGKQIMTLHEENSNLNKQLSKEKSTVSFLLEEKKKLKSDFKTREDKLLDKQIQLEKKIKELNNILVKTSQSIQTIHILSPKPDSFYHTEQKMALGYQNPFYLKQAQKKQQSLYDGKVLLEKHDLPVVHDSEETLQLAQESREKMKQLNKEIKPANYTKINHLLGVFVSQTAKSREELYFSNDSKTANVSKTISIPNEEFSDDTTPSVARKFLNEEVAKFVGDFKCLAKEADESHVKHKALELEIERLLKAVVSQDIMSVVQKTSVVDTSNLQTELEPDGKLCDKNNKESWALLEGLTLYDNKSWNNLRDFAKLVKAISMPHDVPSTSDRRTLEHEDEIKKSIRKAIMFKRVTRKMGMEGNFVISCNVGGTKDTSTLVDQGSDVNIIPISIYNRLTYEKLVETDVRLSLASNSHIYPLGVAEHVLVEVIGFVYPVDFMILDIKEDVKKPLILGTPFLTTARAEIKFDKAFGKRLVEIHVIWAQFGKKTNKVANRSAVKFKDPKKP
nr:hypothetical protein [Tanacetum cinerariifolium]